MGSCAVTVESAQQLTATGPHVKDGGTGAEQPELGPGQTAVVPGR